MDSETAVVSVVPVAGALASMSASAWPAPASSTASCVFKAIVSP